MCSSDLSQPGSFIGSGGKTRFYGNLRPSVGGSPLNSPSRTNSDQEKDFGLAVKEVEDLYERTRTMQTESDYSANFEVYGSESEDEEGGKLSAQITAVQTGSPSQWNGVRQASNSTGFDLNRGYAGLGSEFGQGMGRRRDVSGKMLEEGRASPERNAIGKVAEEGQASPTKTRAAGWENPTKTAAGWEAFRDLLAATTQTQGVVRKAI